MKYDVMSAMLDRMEKYQREAVLWENKYDEAMIALREAEHDRDHAGIQLALLKANRESEELTTTDEEVEAVMEKKDET